MEERDLGGWIIEFLLRQDNIPDPTLNLLLTRFLPLSPSFSLYNLLLLRRLRSQTEASTDVLDILELIEEVHFVGKVPVKESLRIAYWRVAEVCGVWRERVLGMVKGCGLVTEEERDAVREEQDERERRNGDIIREERERRKEDAIREDIERREVDAIGEGREREKLEERKRGDGREREKREEIERREDEAMGAVRAYVAEAWEELGPSFLEVVAGIFGVVELESEGITKEVICPENNQVLHELSMSNNGNNVSQHTKKRSRGAKITETEQVKNQDLLKRYDCVSTPAVDRLQEALTTSSLELHAVVKDSLPEALQFIERVLSSNQKVKMGPTNNASRPSIKSRNSTACTYERGDSIENLPESDSDIRSRIKLPSPKNIVVSPLKKHVMKNFNRRRTVKKWSVIEEATLRTGVEKYGKGCWKTILNSYPDIFKERTDVDLKDKWRNITRYSH